MGFAALSSGGEPTGYMAYKAKEDIKWNVDGNPAELTKILIDYDSLKTGWLKIAAGEAPHSVWADVAGTTVERPSDDHREAFQLEVYLKTDYGSPVTGWRTWSSNQASARVGLERIGAELDAGAKDNPGKAAVVEIEGCPEQRLGRHVQPVPKFNLVGWADKPATVEAAPEPEPVGGEPEDANVF